MSVGAAPNLSGGIWANGVCGAVADSGNGFGNFGPAVTCDPGCGPSGGTCGPGGGGPPGPTPGFPGGGGPPVATPGFPGGGGPSGPTPGFPGGGGTPGLGPGIPGNGGGPWLTTTPPIGPPLTLFSIGIGPSPAPTPILPNPSTGPGTSCQLPAGGPAPPAVQSSGDSCSIEVTDATIGGFVGGISVKCLETGVTLGPTTCVPLLIPVFSVPDFGSTYNFTTQGGPGENCSNSTNYNYGSGSTTATGGGATATLSLSHV
jgi:hypothetical protein